jgi:hypothetical protein
MGSHRYSMWIAAPPECVYDLYTDLHRVGEWQEGNPTITDVSGDADRAGAAYTVRRGRAASRSEVTVAERPTRQVVRIDGPLGLRAEITSLFTPEGNGTRLTIALQTEWRFAPLGRVLEWVIFNPGIGRRELGKLKVIAEREVRDKTA